MLDAACQAVELSQGKKVGDLDPDNETALALARLLEIMGEAAGRVTLELRGRYPEIPWRDIGDTRNRVIHQYFDVDMEIVEAIVRNDLPPLAERLKVIVGEMEQTGGSDDV
ncbi:MAG: HepT-like ribonuclease domain-containing protein [Rubrobacteraceae bacterium]